MASMLPFYDSLEKRLGTVTSSSGVRTKPWPLFILGISMLVVATVFAFGVVSGAVSLALFLAPLWLPLVIIGGAWRLWLILKRSEFIAKQEYILLEIRPPRSIEKTPLAMEAVLSGFHHAPGEGTWYRRYIEGSVRPWWSLEIASLEGDVHLFVWTRRGYRRLIEAHVYAQYPGAQVVEAPDYTRLVSAREEEWNIWGCEFKKTKDDPIPIKTYVEYGLDKVQEESEQVDPLAHLIELMGSMRKGEYLWLQFVIRVHRGEKYNKVRPDGRPYTWHDKAREIIDDIRKKTRQSYVDPASGKELPGFPSPTKGQSDLMAAIERNVSKLPFDVGMRGIYLAKPESFDPVAIGGLTGVFKQFSAEGDWNAIAPTGGMTMFNDYPWEIGSSRLKSIIRKVTVEGFRRRQFFYDPIVRDTAVMSTEEIATLFHVPSRAVEAPALSRIQSSTAEAPPNLPV